MSEIGRWLENLSLGQLASTFAGAAIDLDVLPEITENDLEKLGIPLGDRKRLMRAIAALGETLPAVASEALRGDRLATPIPRAPEAERRQLTVLFCDLVGSTELSAKLDPEDMGQVIRAYHGACTEVVGRWDGHVAKYMGDGVLAYFGWPQAHEDDSERAVRAGLELVEAVTALDAPGLALGGGREDSQRLAVRVGIATGLVMVGELIGQGAAQEQTVVGETPNLAARLQALAAPGSVVISQGTRRLVGGLFELADLGPRHLKGFTEPLAAWRVEGEGRAEGRFEALHGASLTPLVGREEELGLLLRRWEQATEGEGQVVLLSGEPGIGKSRITRALQQRLSAESYTRLLYFCSPYHQNSALYPVITQLQRAAQFARDDNDGLKLEKLETLFALSTGRLDDVVPLVAALLSIPIGDRYPPFELSREQQKARTLEALAGQLDGLATRQPVLLIFEDVHWIDPTSLELLDLLIERVRTIPLLLLITFRPEFKPPWVGQPHATSLTLNRLSRRQGAAFVQRLTSSKPLPAEVFTHIVAKTDGVPLFIEELTKTVLESGLLHDEGDRYALLGPLPPLAIPATLHDSLTARLDRLIPVKEVAQVGAAIGREFSYELLAPVCPLHENELHEALERLESSELVFRRGTPPHATFTFKHALVQDAAYDSLLRSKRQQIHANIARVLEERFPDTAQTQPEVLAHHYTEAGFAEQATHYWLKAGQRAAERSANVEAISHLSQGLEVLKAVPDSLTRAELEMELQSTLSAPLMATKGYAALETGAALARARELCEQLRHTDRLFPNLYGQWAYHIVGGEHQTARQRAERFLSLAEGGTDPAKELVGHRILGVSLFHLGELQSSKAQTERALAIYDPECHQSLAFHYGQDPRAAALSFLSLTLWLTGFPDRAAREIGSALQYAEDLKHANTRGYVLVWGAATLAGLRRELSAVREHADAAISLSEDHGLGLWLASGKLFQGWALAKLDRQTEGTAELVKALADCQRTRTRMHRPFHLSLLADTRHHFAQTEQGLDVLTEGLALVEETEERWWQAELHRLKGVLLLALGSQNRTEAEACYHQAISVARHQGARSLELRAAMSLGRLWRGEGKRSEAYDLLAPIYGWFTEGFDTADLQDAKALLDELC